MDCPVYDSKRDFYFKTGTRSHQKCGWKKSVKKRIAGQSETDVPFIQRPN
jgi:hypothetical protein